MKCEDLKGLAEDLVRLLYNNTAPSGFQREQNQSVHGTTLPLQGQPHEAVVTRLLVRVVIPKLADIAGLRQS